MSFRRLVVATENEHKLGEYRALLAPVPLQVVSLRAAGGPELPEETGQTFEENALIKARHCVLHTGEASLGDDSGLEVAALRGEPGIRSSRWAGPAATDADRLRLLLDRMKGILPEERDARFVCVVAVVLPDGEERTFQGVLNGVLTTEPRGAGGFGYDPILYVPELGRTVGELSPEEKNEISHRGRAARAATAWLAARFQDPAASGEDPYSTGK